MNKHRSTTTNGGGETGRVASFNIGPLLSRHGTGKTKRNREEPCVVVETPSIGMCYQSAVFLHIHEATSFIDPHSFITRRYLLLFHLLQILDIFIDKDRPGTGGFIVVGNVFNLITEVKEGCPLIERNAGVGFILTRGQKVTEC